jgi:hypothetical protein
VEGPMTAQLRRSLAAAYAAFSESRNTTIARIILIVLFGGLTLAGMSDFASHENSGSIADWFK